MRYATLVAAAMLAAASSASWAQSAEHSGHHPEPKEAPAASEPTPAPDQPGSSGAQSGMMGGRMPMMDMMQSMGMMRQGDGVSGAETIDYVEGRIAFLRAELKITDAQNSAWNGFSDALRANAKALAELRKSMASQSGNAAPGLVDRLTLQEKWLAARLEGTRAIRDALATLVATLSDEQKKLADELLAPHIGMMSMMAGMRGASRGMGQMQPGKTAR